MDNTAIVSVQEQKQLQLLNNGLITADRFINKNYLINISEQNIVPLDEYEKTTNSIRLFQIIKLVYDKTENINDKLISVYSALQNVDSSALLVINGNGREVTFYIGIRSVDNAATASKILEKSFVGNFPGSTLRSMKNGEIMKELDAEAGIGLIEKKRQGQGKPTVIYVKQFVIRDVQECKNFSSEEKPTIPEVKKLHV